MPRHKSNFKRMRTSKKQNLYNRQVKSSIKTLGKKFSASTEENSDGLLRELSSELDRAVKKGVIPKRRADRKKSRLAREINRRQAA
jgi:small subunit ribosomal protein S20